MNRIYWLSIIFSVSVSGSLLLWGWHDKTMSRWDGSDMRQQTRADHAAAIGFAIARVALAILLLEATMSVGKKEK